MRSRELAVDAMKPHGRPCARCPWSRATPPGEFPLERYEALRNTVGAPGAEASAHTLIEALVGAVGYVRDDLTERRENRWRRPAPPTPTPKED